ncbi:hypothetical protein [Yersinia enterocolitica]|uniref:hypothetical protein n=1 Tax=Yersinia enterocolitica TaxID=630 RepID=UPI001C60DFFC|nr:hypothetical protein [Yersinia enterocolitica]MBW5877591.1 hypothetical protein [Yersinia enterocolitica]
MSKSIEALITDLKAAAHEEIMLRESGDTSDKWQDEASPENILLLIAEFEKVKTYPRTTNQGQKRIIGWRMKDYTNETTNKEVARNWASAVGVLPIFEGDINTNIEF